MNGKGFKKHERDRSYVSWTTTHPVFVGCVKKVGNVIIPLIPMGTVTLKLRDHFYKYNKLDH